MRQTMAVSQAAARALHAALDGPQIERLGYADGARLISYFVSLSPAYLIARFGRALQEVDIRAYVAQLDFDTNIVIAVSEPDTTIVGTVEVSMLSMDAHWGELSFTAIDEHVFDHLHEHMLKAAVSAARRAGMELLVVNGVCFDPRIRGVLTRTGFDLVVHEGGISGEMALLKSAA